MTSWWASATGASAWAATRTLARWFCAVMGSPRFSRALPPRATRTRTARSAPESGHEQRLDGVQAALGLVEHDAGRRLEHLAGDLEPVGHARVLHHLLAHHSVGVVEGGEAVHELDPGVARLLQQGPVHLVGGEEVD